MGWSPVHQGRIFHRQPEVFLPHCPPHPCQALPVWCHTFPDLFWIPHPIQDPATGTSAVSSEFAQKTI